MTTDPQVEAAAARLAAAPDFPADYVERVRRAAGRLSASALEPDDVRGAVALLEEHTTIDALAPTQSGLPAASYVKRAVRKATLWYMNYVAAQVTLMGQAVVRLGSAVAERVEKVEREQVQARDELAELRERVARLENHRGTQHGP